MLGQKALRGAGCVGSSDRLVNKEGCRSRENKQQKTGLVRANKENSIKAN